MAGSWALNIETTSPSQFEREYAQVISMLKAENVPYSISEDAVELGPDKRLLLTCFTFVITSTLSGATYDLLKSLAVRMIESTPIHQRENIDIKIVRGDQEQVVEVISAPSGQLIIRFPDPTEHSPSE